MLNENYNVVKLFLGMDITNIYKDAIIIPREVGQAMKSLCFENIVRIFDKVPESEHSKVIWLVSDSTLWYLFTIS